MVSIFVVNNGNFNSFNVIITSLVSAGIITKLNSDTSYRVRPVSNTRI